jgi:hypothetical protein
VLEAGKAEQWAGEGTNHGGLHGAKAWEALAAILGKRGRVIDAEAGRLPRRRWTTKECLVSCAILPRWSSGREEPGVEQCNELLHTDLLTRYKLSASHTLGDGGQWRPPASTSFRDA